MNRNEALNKAIGVLTYHQVNFCKSKEAVANMNEIIEALENIDQECVADKDINVLTTDCISREAVMHVLDEVGGDFDSPREAVVPIDYIADMISELPSVSPQPCENAISRDAVLDLVADYDLSMGQVVKGIHALQPVSSMPKWIPVSERLPEEGVSVLVYAERNAYGDNGKYRKKVIDIGWQVDGHWHIDGCNGVVGIAWMPLPPVWEGEK